MPDSLLRVLTCGSVDDGKSTLIGRLLFDCGSIPDDVMAALEHDSVRFGTVEGGVDYALLVDGLEAEREQGVTIDVAYRFFETPRRRFILADTPGHQQYTRNMATGASTADLAILLVDARNGLLDQTRRHAAIASLLGIRSVILAVEIVEGTTCEDTLIKDWELLGRLNEVFGARGFRGKNSAPPADTTRVEQAIDRGSSLVRDKVSELGLPFRFPEVEAIAVLWPVASIAKEQEPENEDEDADTAGEG